MIDIKILVNMVYYNCLRKNNNKLNNNMHMPHTRYTKIKEQNIIYLPFYINKN